jgi:hypothetical protein
MWRRAWLAVGTIVSLAAGIGAGCSAGKVEETDDNGPTPTVTRGAGGMGGTGGGSGGGQAGQAGSNLPCGMDCSAIATPQCLQSVCNQGEYQGVIGECVVVPSPEGETCDDGEFCTIDDGCNGDGQCAGGPPNDCGLTPDQCNVASCDEASDSCNQVPGPNGGACQDPNNLCLVGSTCNNGLCVGGMLNDCFFTPVPDECHVAVCNPMTGMCEPQPGNEGDPCTDPLDLCTIQKTCMAGVCQGGLPKDCSQLTLGCVLGVCDTTSGMCVTQNLMNGDPCDDLDSCTTGEICQTGMCANGTPITSCVDNDGCCPMSCTAQTDLDCACTTQSIITSYVTNNGFNGTMFDITALANIEILSFDANVATGPHTMEIYYKQGSHVGFENSAVGWTLIGSAMVTSAGMDLPTPVPLAVNVQIPQGQTYAFYVTTTGTSNRYINGTAIGNVYVQNQHLQVKEGTGKSYPFASNFVPRVFSGTVHYEECGN